VALQSHVGELFFDKLKRGGRVVQSTLVEVAGEQAPGPRLVDVTVDSGKIAPELLHLGDGVRLVADLVLRKNVSIECAAADATHDLVLGGPIRPMFLDQLLEHADLIRTQGVAIREREAEALLMVELLKLNVLESSDRITVFVNEGRQVDSLEL
jgi:hypothetical protein